MMKRPHSGARVRVSGLTGIRLWRSHYIANEKKNRDGLQKPNPFPMSIFVYAFGQNNTAETQKESLTKLVEASLHQLHCGKKSKIS